MPEDENGKKEKIKDLKIKDVEKIEIKDPSEHHKEKNLPDIVEKTWKKAIREAENKEQK